MKVNFIMYAMFGTLFGSISIISGWNDIVKMRITSIIFLVLLSMMTIAAGILKNRNDAVVSEEEQ